MVQGWGENDRVSNLQGTPGDLTELQLIPQAGGDGKDLLLGPWETATSLSRQA